MCPFQGSEDCVKIDRQEQQPRCLWMRPVKTITYRNFPFKCHNFADPSITGPMLRTPASFAKKKKKKIIQDLI